MAAPHFYIQAIIISCIHSSKTVIFLKPFGGVGHNAAGLFVIKRNERSSAQSVRGTSEGLLVVCLSSIAGLMTLPGSLPLARLLLRRVSRVRLADRGSGQRGGSLRPLGGRYRGLEGA